MERRFIWYGVGCLFLIFLFFCITYLALGYFGIRQNFDVTNQPVPSAVMNEGQ